LFNSIVVSKGEGTIIRELNLIIKQYYSRISGMLDAGLIKRYKGKHSLTLLGKVVYNSQITIGKALTYYWKLKSIESIQVSTADKGLAAAELSQIIDTLIDNYKIKDILLKELLASEDKQLTSSSFSSTTEQRRREVKIIKVD
jgi:predicted transcriptional regulator with HTH domain